MKYFSIAALLVLSLAGCNRAGQNKEAIRQGVIEHVSSKVNIAAMDVDVTAIAFKGEEADATVSFRAKGGPPESGMQMRYTLEQKGGKWVVKDKAESGGSPHGAAPGSEGMPPGHPPLGSGDPAGAMPPGHPPIDSGEARK